MLTELGRQPWIVQGLLLTQEREFPRRSARPGSRSAWGSSSCLYIGLLVLDIWLMRRYAGQGPGRGRPRGRRRAAGGAGVLMESG